MYCIYLLGEGSSLPLKVQLLLVRKGLVQWIGVRANESISRNTSPFLHSPIAIPTQAGGNSWVVARLKDVNIHNRTCLKCDMFWIRLFRGSVTHSKQLCQLDTNDKAISNYNIHTYAARTKRPAKQPMNFKCTKRVQEKMLPHLAQSMSDYLPAWEMMWLDWRVLCFLVYSLTLYEVVSR